MKETTTKIESKSLEHAGRTGLIPGVVHLALDVADRGQATAFGVLQDARTELRTAVDSGLELAEKLATGALRFARKLVAKIDDAANDTLAGAGSLASGAVKSVRDTTRAANDLAVTAASGVAGQAA